MKVYDHENRSNYRRGKFMEVVNLGGFKLVGKSTYLLVYHKQQCLHLQHLDI